MKHLFRDQNALRLISCCLLTQCVNTETYFHCMYQNPPDWQEILQYFRGSELQNYFTKILEDDLKVLSIARTFCISNLCLYMFIII